MGIRQALRDTWHFARDRRRDLFGYERVNAVDPSSLRHPVDNHADRISDSDRVCAWPLAADLHPHGPTGTVPGLIVLTKPVDTIALAPLAVYYATECFARNPRMGLPAGITHFDFSGSAQLGLPQVWQSRQPRIGSFTDGISQPTNKKRPRGRSLLSVPCRSSSTACLSILKSFMETTLKRKAYSVGIRGSSQEPAE